MLILIQKSELFTKDPAIRFAKSYGVHEDIWRDLWRRMTILGYSDKDIREYFKIKSGKDISHQNIRRWAKRTAVYLKIKTVLDMGCLSVDSIFFDELEDFVVRELLKNLQSSVKHNPKTVL